MIKNIVTKPFEGQRPGTSGLRKKVTVFQTPGYIENFVQSVFDSLEGFAGGTLVLGGDGRYFNREAAPDRDQDAPRPTGSGARWSAAAAILSTPAVSCLIRKYGAFGGIVLIASHNPGGPEGDFGIKYNIGNGGPAPEKVTETIFAHTRTIARYRIVNAPDIDLDQLGAAKSEA